MAEHDKGLGSKIKGLFFESDEQGEGAPEKSAAELVAELAKGSAAAPGAPAAQPPPPMVGPPLKAEKLATQAGAPTDFDAIFRDAGMDAAELERVKKGEELLKGLPADTPEGVKRQIVEASLKAFGIELEKIVSAANNQKRALDTYVKVNEQATQKSTADAEGQIKALHEKVAALKADIEKRSAHLRSLSEAAAQRKAQVQKVIEFFERPVAPKT